MYGCGIRIFELSFSAIYASIPSLISIPSFPYYDDEEELPFSLFSPFSPFLSRYLLVSVVLNRVVSYNFVSARTPEEG